MAEIFTTGMHPRYRMWLLVFGAAMVAVLLWFWQGTPSAKVLFGTVAFVGVTWRLEKRKRLEISSSGIHEQGYLLTTSVRWKEIASYRITDEDENPRLVDWDSSVGDIIAWPFLAFARFFFVRPARWLGRLAIYGRHLPAFYLRELELLGRDGKSRFILASHDRYEHKLEAIERIIAELVERGVTVDHSQTS